MQHINTKVKWTHVDDVAVECHQCIARMKVKPVRARMSHFYWCWPYVAEGAPVNQFWSLCFHPTFTLSFGSVSLPALRPSLFRLLFVLVFRSGRMSSQVANILSFFTPLHICFFSFRNFNLRINTNTSPLIFLVGWRLNRITTDLLSGLQIWVI